MTPAPSDFGRPSDAHEQSGQHAVRRLHSISRDISPGEAWQPHAPLADPLLAAIGTVLVGLVLGVATWALWRSHIYIVADISAFACVAAAVILALIVGRALVRDNLIAQWEASRQARRDLAVERRRVTALRATLAAAATPRTVADLTSSLNQFAAASFDLVRTIDSAGGLIVARQDDTRFLVEDVRGRLWRGESVIEAGVSWLADKPFSTMISATGDTTLATTAWSPAGDTYLLGVVISGTLDPADRRLLSVLDLAFSCVVGAPAASPAHRTVTGLSFRSTFAEGS